MLSNPMVTTEAPMMPVMAASVIEMGLSHRCAQILSDQRLIEV